MSNKKEKFVIIDGNAIIHRAYHALPPLTDKQGVQVNAVYGFASMLIKILDSIKPKYLAVSFDVAKKTFRDKLYVEYKAKRVKADQELYDQIPLVHELVKAFDIPIYEKAGYEADDVIGSVAKKLEKIWDGEVIIASGDKDLLQLVSKNTKVYLLKKGISDVQMYDEKEVENRLGFSKNFLVDFKAIKGDPSDNIPGVSGLGDKGALELINKIGHLEDVYEQIDSLEEKGFKKRTVELLKKSKEQAFLSKKLATIITDVKGLNFKLKDCATHTIDKDVVVPLFHKFGFTSLTKRLLDFLGEKETDNIKENVGNDLRVIINVEKNNFDSTLNELKTTKEFFCKEILGGRDIFENNPIGFVCGTRKDIYFFDFKKLDTKEKKLFYSLFNEKNILVGHDIKQLLKVLILQNIEPKNSLFDLMIASYLINSETRAHDLKSMLARELGKELKEEKQISLFGESNEIVPEGVEYFLELYDIYHKNLDEQKNDDLFHKIEMQLVPTLAKMELNGIAVNSEKMKVLGKIFGNRIEEISAQIWEFAGKHFNIASSVQLRDVLFLDMGLPTTGIKKGKTGYSTASSELSKLRSIHKIIPLIEEFRELSKLKNTYVDVLPKLVNKKTGRIHADFNQAVTTTGRLSSSNPNLQNIPTRSQMGQKIREAFEAEKDYIFVSADYSQIELRIVASLAQDKKMLEIFKQGKDIHKATAVAINGVPEDKVTKEMRSAAKAVNFGVLYGMGSYGLASSAGISEYEARNFIQKYFEEFKDVKKFMDDTLENAKKNGYVETFFGRRRYVSELRATNFQVKRSGERMAINMPIQGTAADLMKLSMAEVYKRIKDVFAEDDVRMVLQVHDELVLEVKKDLAEKASKLLQDTMETVQHFDHSMKMTAPIVVNTGYGKNWGELK